MPLEDLLNEHQLRCSTLAEGGAPLCCFQLLPFETMHAEPVRGWTGEMESCPVAGLRDASFLEGGFTVCRPCPSSGHAKPDSVWRGHISTYGHGYPPTCTLHASDCSACAFSCAGTGLWLQKRARHVFREARRVPEFRDICHAPHVATEDKLARLGALMDASQASCRRAP